MKRFARVILWLSFLVVVIGAVIGLVALLILPTPWFAEKVRQRIVSETERATGGRVEIGRFHFDWTELRATVAPFALHGKEPEGEAPLFRADRIKLGLKLISVWKRDIDIESLVVERPFVNILVDAQGNTNFPTPRIPRTSPANPIARLIDLAVSTIDLRDGHVRYADKRSPLNLRADNLRAQFDYDFSGPRYSGDVVADRLNFSAGPTLPIAFDLKARVHLERAFIRVQDARLHTERSRVETSGTVTPFGDVEAKFTVKVEGDLAELGKPLRLPEPHVGRFRFEGQAAYNTKERYLVSGALQATGLALRVGDFEPRQIALRSSVRVDPAGVLLTGLDAKLLGGRVNGSVRLHDFRQYRINANANSLSLQSIAAARGLQRFGWSGTVTGPFEATGTLGRSARDLRAGGRFRISPAREGSPVQGHVELAYDQLAGRLSLGDSFLSTAATSIRFSGALGNLIEARVESRNLQDLLPVLAMVSENAPETMPLRLEPGGEAIFEGTLSGDLKTGTVEGRLNLRKAAFRGQIIDNLVTDLTATSTSIQARTLALGQGDLKMEGRAGIGLTGWRVTDDSALSGRLTLQGARVSKLLAATGQTAPVEGLLSATVDLSGTVRSPSAESRLSIEKPSLFGEQFDRFLARITYKEDVLRVRDATAEIGRGRAFLNAVYTHDPNDWKNGRITFDIGTRGLDLSQIQNVRNLRPDVRGAVRVTARGSAEIRGASILPSDIDGQISVRDLSVASREAGDVVIDASTRGTELVLAVLGNLRGSRLEGQGRFHLTGDYPGQGSIRLSTISFATLQDLVTLATGRPPLPVEGSVSGHITFSGPARTPEKMTARLEIPSIVISPAARSRTAQQVENLTVKNADTVILEYDTKGIHVRQARLVGRDTDLRVSGTMNVLERNPWDLRVAGNVNLAVLQDFRGDLLTSGTANVNASVRGSLADPQLSGRMEIQNASFYLADVPNGIDQAKGVVLFDRNRATIEKLTAQTGGGTLDVSGFIGFGNQLTYRLQARLDRVRFRYPEGVSTTVNATLTLAGSSERSLLSGVVSVMKAGFNPRTDIGSLLAASAKPIATPTTPNEFLRGMNLDVQIETAPNLTFQTALTSDLQAEADLRLRGTAAKPAVLGRVSVNEGEIQFFGNRYTINRGEINFFNPVSIEPILDMDLETRVRGVLVNINVTGPLKRLNVSYRSDPPLQSNEIVALLAVGRAPGTSSTLASGQTVQQNLLGASSNSLLAQAIAAPVSSRLQRFFGISRLKIDPQLTGINAVPQARVTIEQQISKDITLTYITNLANAQQQIVRLEWDLNRNWSLVALREENGVFGVDFFYKARFK